MDTTIYSSPVDKLLTLGKPESVLPEKWPNYLELGHGHPFLNLFKNISASSPEQQETSSPTTEESYLLPPPPARTPSHSSDKVIKFSGKRITKKKSKKKR